MRYKWFKLGFGITTIVFVVLNIISYLRERDLYFQYLKETGIVWYGSWSWGFPFVLMLEGLGTESEKYSRIVPGGAVLNIICWLVTAGLVGIMCEFLAARFWPEDL